MKIGIDAKWYFEGPPSGLRVTQNLIRILLEYDRVNEYFIFLNEKHKDRDFPYQHNERTTCVYIWAGNNLLSNVFTLPRKANLLVLDVMVFMNFVSPFYRGRKIVYIYDILYVSFPEYFTRKEKLYFFFIKYLTRSADMVMTLSKEEKKRLIKHGFASDLKIEPVYIGVDDVFKPLENQDQSLVKIVKEKFHLPERFLLYVGRLNSRKNIENLIIAMSLLKDKTIPLIVAGKEDWKYSNYKGLAEQYGVMHRINFTGWTEENELPVIYALSTVFCFPSFAEGFGLPPLEAMASGIPVIVSNTTALPEICGPAGNYVDPNRPHEIADVIDNLLSNAHLYSEKKNQGLDRANKFTWANTAQVFMHCVQSLIKEKQF